MTSLEQYLNRADELAQEVVNTWGSLYNEGKTIFTPEFKALLDLACEYRTAKETADNHREFNLLGEGDASKEKKTRESFVKAYIALRQQREI